MRRLLTDLLAAPGRLAAVGLLTALAFAPGLVALAGPGAEGDDAQVRTDPIVATGAEVYAWNCAVCHGATGGGIEEARLAFPEDDRRCTRCHRPSNRAVQPLDQPFVDNDMFSVGDPPALHPAPDRPATLAGTASPEALFTYLRQTMPRYDPGRLTDDEYRALTAFLLEMNGRAAAVPEVPGL